MIHSKDRSGWIGASDTARVMGSWSTESFRRWWAVKLGVYTNDFSNAAMRAGTAYEHPILDALGIRKRDRRIKIRRLRLRVNLDGETKDTIHEVKTHAKEPFKLSRAYWMQAQVEMFASGFLPLAKRKRLVIEAYRLLPEDYLNFFNKIDLSRVSKHSVVYDSEWIQSQYLPRLRVLARCLKRGVFPEVAE